MKAAGGILPWDGKVRPNSVYVKVILCNIMVWPVANKNASRTAWHRPSFFLWPASFIEDDSSFLSASSIWSSSDLESLLRTPKPVSF